MPTRTIAYALAFSALTAVAGTAGIEEATRTLYEHSFAGSDAAVPLEGGERALRFSDGYSVFATPFIGKGLGPLTVSVSVEAASPDGAQLGVRIWAYDEKRKRIDTLSSGIWRQRLDAKLAVLATGPAGVELPKETHSVRLGVYRANQRGTLYLKSIHVVALKTVPTEKLVAEVAATLREQGYEVHREGELLVGEKPDERRYYRTFPGQSMTPAAFSARSFVGVTWLRTVFRAPFFPAGPYIYGGPEAQQVRAEKLGLTLDAFFEHLARDVKAHGGNTIYYGNLTIEPEVFRRAVAAARKHGVHVFGQLTRDLYLRPTRGREHYEQVTLTTARRILPQYRGLEGVAAWMPKEEAAPDEVELLRAYRNVVRELDPTHAVFTLHNSIGAFRLDTKNLPEWLGFDRYRFRCLHGPYGLLISTPKDMARRLGADIAEFAAEAAERGRPLIYVLQGYGHQNVFSAEDIRGWSGGEKDALDPCSGFKRIGPKRWLGWDRYPPPEHGMHLQNWLAVSEGAKGLLIFHYGPRKPREGTPKHINLVKQDGAETRLWREFGECMRDMQPFLPLILSWHREAIAWAKTDHPQVVVRSFIRRFDAERYLIVQNRRIATWDKNSPALPRGDTDLHFDEHGLAGLRTAGPLAVRLTVEGTDPVWNLRTGEQLEPLDTGDYKLTIKPGRAAILMQGSDTALDTIRTELGFTGE